MDVIDSILESLKLKSSILAEMEFSGSWGLDKPALKGAPFYAVVSGELWLKRASQPEPMRLQAGEVVLLPQGDAHALMSEPEVDLVPLKGLLQELGWDMWVPGSRYKTGVLRLGSGSNSLTRIISGVIGFGDRRDNPLLSELPPVLRMRPDSSDQASPASPLAATVSLLEAEIASRRPGSGTVAALLADILFIQAVRLHLDDNQALGQGWLRGIADPQVGRALSLMHGQPDKAWSVVALAEAAGMSRSRFADRFQNLVGRAPLDYLTHWRMYEAAGKLADGKMGLALLASTAGYVSPMGFSKAFKRWSGYSPADYRRRHASSGAVGSPPAGPEGARPVSRTRETSLTEQRGA